MTNSATGGASAQAAITGFHTDDDGHWVAELSCGHSQHVRHQPPWEMRPWVASEDGRRSMLGSQLACIHCELPVFPADAHVYKRTAEWTERTLPAALRRRHDTKPGVWARIVVVEGRVRFEILEDDATRAWVLWPGVVGVAPPTVPHRLALIGPVRLYVEFATRRRGHDRPADEPASERASER